MTVTRTDIYDFFLWYVFTHFLAQVHVGVLRLFEQFDVLLILIHTAVVVRMIHLAKILVGFVDVVFGRGLRYPQQIVRIGIAHALPIVSAYIAYT